MEWAAVVTLLLSGFFSLSHTAPEKIFHFIGDKMNFPSAQKHCTENFVDLVSIADVTDMARLIGLVKTEDSVAFVGLRKEWQWDILDTEDQREAELKLNKFEDGEPQEERTCGMIKPSGEWTTEGCEQVQPFICLNETSSDKFVKPNETLNYSDAKEYCKEHYTDLARVHTEAENQQLASLCNGTRAWVGLRTNWAWSDGTSPGYVYWRLNPSNVDHCSALYITARPVGIISRDCNSSLPFFCYSYARKKYTMRITLSAAEAGDLANSAADSVTKLVQSKLSERGFSKDVRLSWSKRPRKDKTVQTPQELECPTITKP